MSDVHRLLRIKSCLISFQSHFRHVPIIKLGVSGSGSGQEYLQHVSLLPGGGLIMVKDNDIYYKATIKTSAVERLTRSGVPGTVYNGVTDWLYEEEILGSEVALWPSRSGARLAYLTFNDTEVELITLRNFSPEEKSSHRDKVRYPKVSPALCHETSHHDNYVSGSCVKSYHVILPSQQCHKKSSENVFVLLGGLCQPSCYHPRSSSNEKSQDCQCRASRGGQEVRSYKN